VRPSGSSNRDFRLYAAGRIVSLAGDRIGIIALVFVIIRLSSNPAAGLAIFYIARVVPSLLGGLLVGVLVDSSDRRRLMIAADLGRAAILIAVPTLGSLSLWSLYPLVIGLYALGLVFGTAARAALPDVVSEARMTGANAVLQSIDSGADMAYVIGGGLVAVLGLRIPFYVDAATFLVSAVLVWQMRLPTPQRSPLPPVRDIPGQIGEGLSVLLSNAVLRWSLVTTIVAPLAGGAMLVLAPLYADHALAHSSGLVGPLHDGAFRFSVLEVCLGLGALTASGLVTMLAKRRPRGQLIAIGAVGMAGVELCFSVIHSIYLAAPLMFVHGAFNGLFAIAALTMMQSLIPTGVRGRVLSAWSTGIDAALALGSAIGGVLLGILSYSTMWLLIGAVIGASSLAIWLRPEVRNQP
jgi:MFS family permease